MSRAITLAVAVLLTIAGDGVVLSEALTQNGVEGAEGTAQGQPPAAAATSTIPPVSDAPRSPLTGQPPLTKFAPTLPSGFNPAQAQQQLSQQSQQGAGGNVKRIQIIGHQEQPYEKMVRLFGRDEVERAYLLYPLENQTEKRIEYLIDVTRATADRQQGNSYSIHAK